MRLSVAEQGTQGSGGNRLVGAVRHVAFLGDARHADLKKAKAIPSAASQFNHPVAPDDSLHDPRLLFAEDNQIV